jgi:hypothetical protein
LPVNVFCWLGVKASPSSGHGLAVGHDAVPETFGFGARDGAA